MTKHVQDLPPGDYPCEMTYRLINNVSGRFLETQIKPTVPGYHGSLTSYRKLPRLRKKEK